jgi:hypothetical protein
MNCLLSSRRLLFSFTHVFVLIVYVGHSVFSHQSMKAAHQAICGFQARKLSGPMLGIWLLGPSVKP